MQIIQVRSALRFDNSHSDSSIQHPYSRQQHPVRLKDADRSSTIGSTISHSDSDSRSETISKPTKCEVTQFLLTEYT